MHSSLKYPIHLLMKYFYRKYSIIIPTYCVSTLQLKFSQFVASYLSFRREIRTYVHGCVRDDLISIIVQSYNVCHICYTPVSLN